MRDCVKLKTCLPSRSFCLAVLYSFGLGAWFWPFSCTAAGMANKTAARNEQTIVFLKEDFMRGPFSMLFRISRVAFQILRHCTLSGLLSNFCFLQAQVANSIPPAITEFCCPEGLTGATIRNHHETPNLYFHSPS